MKDQSGQALIEALVVVGVSVILSVALLVGATGTLRSSRFSKAKTLSVRYAQEGMEVARQLRNRSWSAFDTCATPSPTTWCLGDTIPSPSSVDSCSDIFSASSAGSCTTNITNGSFKRSVTFTRLSATSVQVDAVVTWTDGSVTYTTPVTSVLTNWQ